MRTKIWACLLTAFAVFFYASAQAQNVGTVTNHALPIGKGAGVQGFTSLGPCGNGFPVVGTGASTDPKCDGTVVINGGSVTGMPSPSVSSDVATKGYVDAISSGITYLAPSTLATAAVLPNTPTYANGTAGVGATLTAGSNTTLTVDGTAAPLNTVVLVKNQASAFQNGIYTVTAAGSGGAPWVLTRATYFDQAAEMKAGSYSFTTAGATNINTAYVLQSTITTVGTDALNFVIYAFYAVPIYTPPGTGGVPEAVGTALPRLPIFANQYGAVCDGVTDDSLAFQRAIDEAIALRVSVRFNGSCKINSTLNITNSVDFGGSIEGLEITIGATGKGSHLIVANDTDGIVVNTNNPVWLHDFSLGSNASATSSAIKLTASAGLTINVGSIVERTSINGFNSGIYAVRATGYKINNNSIQNTTLACIRLEDLTNADAGDGHVSLNTLSGCGQSGIYYLSGGGLRVLNNKINGASFGIWLHWTTAASTSGFTAVANNIENITTTGILIDRQGAGPTFTGMNINDNKLNGIQCVSIPTDATSAWVLMVAITGNICITSGGANNIGFNIDATQGFNITGNTIYGLGTPNYGIGLGVQTLNGVIGPNSRIGSFSASLLSGTNHMVVSCTLVTGGAASQCY